MKPFSFSFVFDEKLFCEYRVHRSAPLTRFYGSLLVVLALPLFALFLLISLEGNFDIETALILLFLLVLTLIGAAFAITGVNPLMGKPSSSVVFEYFSQHSGGSDNRPWTFQSFVTLDNEGITIGSGPRGSQQAMSVQKKNWSEWSKVVRSKSAIIVLSKTQMGPSVRWLFGAEAMLVYDSKRNEFEDAVIPLSELGHNGLPSAEELLSYLNKQIH